VQINLGKLIAIFLLTLLLTSCGGGGGSDAIQQTNPVDNSPADTAPLTISTGAITGFGSVFVSGVEYETNAAEITMNNNVAAESNLHIGMVVTIQGEIHQTGLSGEAHSIHYSENVRGPVASIDGSAETMMVLGQSIHMTELTIFEGVEFETLVVGDMVEVSGFTDADNNILASRVGAAEILEGAAEFNYSAIGIITNLNVSDATFMLGGQMVQYDGANTLDATLDDLVDGMTVRVTALQQPAVAIWVADEIEVIEHLLPGAEGDHMVIEGVIMGIPSSGHLMVDGVEIILDDTTNIDNNASLDDLDINSRITVNAIRQPDGMMIAQDVWLHQESNLLMHDAITEIDPSSGSIVVGGLTFMMSNATRFVDHSIHGVRAFGLDDFSVGDFIEIRWQEGSSPDTGQLATLIRRHDDEMSMDFELTGMVDTIDAHSISMLGMSINMFQATDFRDENGHSLSFDEFQNSLQVGDTVTLMGSHAGDNSFNASALEFVDSQQGMPDRFFELDGSIEEIDPTNSTLEMHGILLQIDPSTEIEDGYGNQLSTNELFAMMEVGARINLAGQHMDGGFVNATHIIFDVGAGEVLQFQGPVTSISIEEATFMIFDTPIRVDQDTRIEVNHGDTLSLSEFFAQLNVGDMIRIEGRLVDETILAEQIEIMSRHSMMGG
jgi:hypothetical protein